MREQREIALTNLTVDTAQSRRQGWDGDESDQRLVNSLEQDGLLHPLIVRPVSCASYGDDVDEDYAIIAGSRRYRAAVRAGFNTVRCLVTDADDATAAEKSLRENRDRKDLSDAEIAESLRLQFELRRPPETTECPGDCDYIIKRSEPRGATAHLRSCDASEEILSVEALDCDHQPAFFTDSQVIRYLSMAYFGGTSEPQLQKIRNYLNVAELPDELQSLWESESSLTEDQRQDFPALELSTNLNITSSHDISDRVVNLYEEISESSDSADPTRATLEVISALEEVDTVNNRQELSRQISEYTEEVIERLNTDTNLSDSAVISEALESHISELVKTSDGISSSRSIAARQMMFDEHKYHRWHARVKQTRGIETDSAVVREAYREYLDEMAEKHGWD